MENKEYKISVCTVCKNRTHHLKETLAKNISGNSDFKNSEFIILDYNSQDDLENWVISNFAHELEIGKLVYYKMPQAKDFKRAHSKNILGRLATGDILCYVDADNFIGSGFLNYVNRVFNKNSNSFITTIGRRKQINKLDVLGRICLWREDFIQVQGYDEFMNDYGYEDFDLAYRVEAIGRKRVLLKEEKYLSAIDHEVKERVESVKSSFKDLFVFHDTPWKSQFLYLFNNGTYAHGCVIDNVSIKTRSINNTLIKTSLNHQYSLKERDWSIGNWRSTQNGIVFSSFDNTIVFKGKLNSDGDTLLIDDSKKVFRKISKDFYLDRALYFYSVLRNLNKMKRNKAERKMSVNGGIYGKGVLYKNFQYGNPIHL